VVLVQRSEFQFSSVFCLGKFWQHRGEFFPIRFIHKELLPSEPERLEGSREEYDYQRMFLQHHPWALPNVGGMIITRVLFSMNFILFSQFFQRHPTPSRDPAWRTFKNAVA
jgi:hypothetical protein